MTVAIKAGSLEDFFASARETAREIDQGKRLTPKNTIWVEPEDFWFCSNRIEPDCYAG